MYFFCLYLQRAIEREQTTQVLEQEGSLGDFKRTAVKWDRDFRTCCKPWLSLPMIPGCGKVPKWAIHRTFIGSIPKEQNGQIEWVWSSKNFRTGQVQSWSLGVVWTVKRHSYGSVGRETIILLRVTLSGTQIIPHLVPLPCHIPKRTRKKSPEGLAHSNGFLFILLAFHLDFW